MIAKPYLSFASLIILLLFAFNISAQSTITVVGEVLKPLTLSVSSLSKMKQEKVIVEDRDNKEHTFEGVPLYDILDSAGVTLGGELRGENLVKYILHQDLINQILKEFYFFIQ